MNCDAIKTLIPLYLDNELSAKELEQVKNHLAGCPVCAQECQAQQSVWQLLGEYEEIQPEPGFIGRFWTRVASQTTWQEKLLEKLNVGVWRQPWVYASLGLCLALIIGSLLFWQNQYPKSSELLANVNEEELEMLENLELVENFDVIQDMEFYEDLEVIENLENLEVMEG